jgi:hypothetical protein
MVNCWIHKLRAILSGRKMDKHAAQCPACRAEQTADRALEDRLRNTVSRAEAPFGFAARVLSRTAREAHSAPESSRTSWLTFAVGAAVILLLCLVVIQRHGNWQRVAPTVAERQVSPSGEPEVVLAGLPMISPAQIGNLGAKLDQPLQNELHYMISDTRQAIQFVASNFIPDER